MPDGLEIEKRKLRGEVSDGMILSERELELGQDHGGIMLLDDALEPGTPLADVLPLGDDVLEIETGYNRPDLTSVYGIAREVAALTGAALNPMPGTNPKLVGDEWVEIQIEDPERCSVYLGRLFHDITVGDSPPWLKSRLLRRRHAPDLERRRRDELRDARARQPAARVRLREAGRAAGSSCGAPSPARSSSPSTAASASSIPTISSSPTPSARSGSPA